MFLTAGIRFTFHGRVASLFQPKHELCRPAILLILIAGEPVNAHCDTRNDCCAVPPNLFVELLPVPMLGERTWAVLIG
jgi:hypothetical protein